LFHHFRLIYTYAGGGGGGMATRQLVLLEQVVWWRWCWYKPSNPLQITANTGGGGGGGGASSAFGGAGGSGIVILKYTVTPATTVDVVQQFNADGTWTCPTGVTEVEYLVVAGGGGGGRAFGGGGGAGGFRTGTGHAVTAGTDYSITVGGGGAQLEEVPHLQMQVVVAMVSYQI
jgi:hypothetical protein